MKPVAAIIINDTASACSDLIAALHTNPLVEKIIVLSAENGPQQHAHVIPSPLPAGGQALREALGQALSCEFIMIIPSPAGLDIAPEEMQVFITTARKNGAALCYADYCVGQRSPQDIRKVCEYQTGSIRDDFSFGPVQLYSSALVRQALESCGALTDTAWAGLYELRLKASCSGSVKKIPAPLSLVCGIESKSHFTYVDPRQLDYQKEMEQVAARHLQRINALCTHELKPAPAPAKSFPVAASVVIPVRNREKTIADAITSALRQKTGFSFNVLVVQNHSTDRTAEKIDAIARHDARVIHIIPERTDHGIGGCWNVALQSPHCGAWVCQLDSDDLYSDENTLASMIEMLRDEKHGMVVGSYRIVSFNLEEIPPGIIDHREWSDANGRNNLLRVNGIGAPRAFATTLLRQFPFPDVSYGEDYAVSLRISRDYTVGRIFAPLYLCRRWEDNTDARLSNEDEVRLATYKDSLRTKEIEERQKLYKK
jgi:hypothetical protein